MYKLIQQFNLVELGLITGSLEADLVIKINEIIDVLNKKELTPLYKGENINQG